MMFKKYPFVKQNGIKECAVAAVLMIVKYYNGNISMTKLSEMLKVTRKGVTAYHIVQTLKALGFNAYGIKEKQLKQTKVPFIANVILNDSYKHYIVVYEVTDNKVLIADPADKLKQISIYNFYKIWTGINIMMYPERPILRIKNNNYLKIFKNLFTPNLKKIIVIAVLSLVMTISGIIGSFFFQILIDNINSRVNIKLLCFVFFALLIIKVMSSYFRNKMLIKFNTITDSYLTNMTFKQIILLPYLYYHNHTTGEVISKTNDLSHLRDTLSKILLTIFIDLPLTIFSGILLFNINKLLFMLIIGMLLGYILIILIFRKKINNYIDKTLKEKALVHSYMTETIGSFETIKGISIEKQTNQRFKEKYDNLIKAKLKLDNLANLQLFIKDSVNNIGQALILIVGIWLIKEKVMSLSLFITYNILMSLFLEPMRNIIDLDFDIKKTFQVINRVFDLYEISEKKTFEKIKTIKLENLNFSFDDIKYTLKNINLIINKGDKILISGESGSGKSTLVKLIKGYYQKYEGKLLVNGKPVNKINSKINYVSQKENIFTGTINDNLKLKNSRDLNRIKRMCYINEIALREDLGYNTLLEEDGFNISGGQKQRIALARALQDFDLLIIDEGFNALNTNLERKIIKNLFKYYKDKTIIVISHRLDNLDLFNRFIKLENGIITLDTKAEKGETLCI